MRLASAELVTIITTCLLGVAACGDDGPGQQADVHDTVVADDTSLADTTVADVGPDAATDVAQDTAPRDTTNPQAGAWQTTWSMDVEGAGARVHALRYLGGQNSASALFVLEVGAGAAALDGGDGDETALPGEGHRVVFVYIDPSSGNVLASRAVELAEDEAVGHVTKGPNGFAVALVSEAGRVVVGQMFGTALRVAVVTLESEDHARLTLPMSADLLQPTTGGGSTPIALGLEAVAVGVLRVAVDDAAVTLEVSAMSGVGFLTLAAPAEGEALPAEGHGLVTVDGLAADRVFETRSGPVLVVNVTASSTLGSTELVRGRRAIVIGALPDEGPIVPLALWQSAAEGTSELDVLQVTQSGGGGLVLAGVGEGRVEFGPDTLESATPRAFIATLGASTGILYTASECDRLYAVTSGFQYRILKTTCDLEGQPALVLTQLTTDFSGDLQEPFDLPLAPLAQDGAVVLHSGLVSLSVTGGRAYGALVDLGDGPRLVLVRSDGQPYDSGVLEALDGRDEDAGPIHFQPLRQGGGGGGGGGATTNAFLFAVDKDGGSVIGRARLDLKTLIW